MIYIAPKSQKRIRAHRCRPITSVASRQTDILVSKLLSLRLRVRQLIYLFCSLQRLTYLAGPVCVGGALNTLTFTFTFNDVTSVRVSLHLRNASQRKLIVPRYRLNSFGRRCFAVSGPSTWNSLPDSLRDPALSLNMFRRQLKTYFFCAILTRCTQRIRDLLIMRYINLHFTYLLTYY